MKCVCPMGGDRTCPDDCPLAVWASLSEPDRKAQRKPIAEKLYREGFTQEVIATQLGVDQKTISRDLEGLGTMPKPPRPKGGRPKGKRQVKRRSGPTPEVEQKMAEGVLDQGKTLEQVTVEAGLPSVQHAKIAVAREEGRREPRPVERDELPRSAQEKLDSAIRAYKKKLEGEFYDRINQRIRELLEETILPQHRKEQAQAQQIMRARKGIMDKASFRLIWSALHPDSRKSISDRKLAEAFNVFSRMEKLLLDEKQSPTNFQKLPQTMAEWDRMRAAASAAKKTKRGKAEMARP